MSRFKSIVSVTTLTLLVGLLVVITSSSAQADEWAPPPPVSRDKCGTREDAYYLYEPHNMIYVDVNGDYLLVDQWISTKGADTVTVIARDATIAGRPDVPFTLTFGAEPDASCTEAPDTVTTRLVECNPKYGQWRVEFTYTNTPDSTGWVHTDPIVHAYQLAGMQHSWIRMTPRPDAPYPENQQPVVVEDGQSVSMTGGDAYGAYGRPDLFDLPPGTYRMTITTAEYPERTLTNQLFVPACGKRPVPPGDPSGLGGPIPGSNTGDDRPGNSPSVNKPKARISMCRAHKVRGVLDGRKAARTTHYRVVVKPKKGKAKRVIRKQVPSGEVKRVVLRKQKTGTVVKVVFAGKTVKRKLKC